MTTKNSNYKIVTEEELEDIYTEFSKLAEETGSNVYIIILLYRLYKK